MIVEGIDYRGDIPYALVARGPFVPTDLPGVNQIS
jgi:hypothetical protein